MMKGVKVHEQYFKEMVAQFPELSGMEIARFMELRKKMAGPIRMVTGTYKLHEAAKEREVAEVEELLEKGADPNFADTRARQMGRTAMHNVFIRKMKSPGDRAYADRITELLIQWGADVNRQSTKRREIPLEMALEKDCWHAAKYLVEAGADVTGRCIDIIARNNVPEIMTWMIESDKFPNDQIYGRALYHRNSFLLKKMLEISDPPKDAYRHVLEGYWGTDSKIIDMLRLLMEDGRADPSIRNHLVFLWLVKHGIDSGGRKENYLDLFLTLMKDPRVNLTRDNNLFLKSFVTFAYGRTSPFLPDWIDFVLAEVPGIKETSTIDPETQESIFHVYLNSLYTNYRYSYNYRSDPVVSDGELKVFKKLVRDGFPFDTRDKSGKTPAEKADGLKFPQEVIDILNGKNFDD